MSQLSRCGPTGFCDFEHLFRSPYHSMGVLSYLEVHDKGSLYFVSKRVRQLLASQRVKIPRGCLALCGFAAYDQGVEQVNRIDSGPLLAVPTRLIDHLVQAFRRGHPGVLRAMYKTARTYGYLEWEIERRLRCELKYCKDDNCLRVALGESHLEKYLYLDEHTAGALMRCGNPRIQELVGSLLVGSITLG